MPDSPYPLRAVAAGELPTFFEVLTRAFGEDMAPGDLEHQLLTAEPERTIAAFDGDDIVGTAGAFTFELAIPGGRVPAAGVTYVSVRSTHRRRGLLNAMMRSQLADIHDRHEPVATLWASESAIYGRYGYGLASQFLRTDVRTVEGALRPDLPNDDSVTLRTVDAKELTDDVVGLEAAIVDDRPGQFVRDRRWIDSALADPESRRAGMSSIQAVRADRGGSLVGYALYRTKNESVRPYGLPDGLVRVEAHSALDAASDIAVTRFLLSTDLMRTVRWWNRPIDTALPHLLRDPRQARTTLLDGIWARVVDLPTALTARRYLSGPIDVTIEVIDDICGWNAGVWRLVTTADGVATCERTSGHADVRLSVESLGAAYLGGTSLGTLYDARRVEAIDPSKLAALSAAFGWHRKPWCPVVF